MPIVHQTIIALVVIMCSVTAATADVVAAAAISSNNNEMHPLEVYVRAACGNKNEPLTPKDIVKAYAVEAEPRSIPHLTKMMAPDIMAWYQQQLESYPILTTSPEQIHITVTNVEGNVTVLWTTSNESQASQVCYYPQDAPLQRTCQNGTVWTYNPISIVPWFGSLHGANMIGLVPAKTYCYAVGDPVLDVFSNDTCFLAPHLTKDSITVAFGGDMGSVQLFGYLVAEQMIDDEIRDNISYDAFWLLGDIAYSTLDPGPQSPNGEFFWDIYMRQEQSFANHVPWLATYGNHDFDAGDSGAFINRFRNPTTGGGLGNFYFAYTHGPVKFVSMCTEVALTELCDYSPGSPQYLWLVEQLSNINRTETPWLILGGHRPMYSSDLATDSGPLQQLIEPLLMQYKVDVEMSGHMHETELVAPVFNNTPYLTGVSQTGPIQWTFVNSQATVHMTAGNMGALQDEQYATPEYPWSLFHSGKLVDDAYGYMRMEANRTTLHFKCLKQSTNTVMWELFMHKTE